VLDELERWQRAELGGVRVVRREHLHVTLAFLGSRPSDELASIVRVLREAAAGAGEIRLAPARYRQHRRVGMLGLADETGRATRVAGGGPVRLERPGRDPRE